LTSSSCDNFNSFAIYAWLKERVVIVCFVTHLLSFFMKIIIVCAVFYFRMVIHCFTEIFEIHSSSQARIIDTFFLLFARIHHRCGCERALKRMNNMRYFTGIVLSYLSIFKILWYRNVRNKTVWTTVFVIYDFVKISDWIF
jgi:hypothetical protein